MAQPLIVIAGPTAVGKSEIAAGLARAVHGEVISADSMQVYRGMDIGSAKVTKEEMLGVPHHLIDTADPTEAYDAARYAEEAKAAIREISGRGRLPILCGGTGFYIQAVVRDIDFSQEGARPQLREELWAFAQQNGDEALHARLLAVDPEAAAAIHPHNRKRVIRAIEYFEETGEKISVHNAREKARPTPYDLLFFYLDDGRENLYRRIDRRVDRMIEAGLVEEVQKLKDSGLTRRNSSMQGLGYEEILAYLDGEYDLAEAVRILKRDTRHFAKRQETWFNRIPGTVRLMRGDFDNDSAQILAEALRITKEHFHL